MNKSKTYQTILNAENLTIGYKSKHNNIVIANDLQLKICEGEMVCLLGQNGCGKSTLIRTLAGMQAALNGCVYIKGNAIKPNNIKTISKQMSVVLTERLYITNFGVYDMVAMGRFPYTNWYGKLSQKDKERIHESLQQVGLTDYQNRDFSTLSDGEKQRVMIAKALAQDTPFIMLDEPTAHLDLPNRIEIMKLLKELAHNTGRSILLSTHELDLALQVSDRIWLMQKNKELLSGTPNDLVQNGNIEKAFQKQSTNPTTQPESLFKIVYM